MPQTPPLLHLLVLPRDVLDVHARRLYGGCAYVPRV